MLLRVLPLLGSMGRVTKGFHVHFLLANLKHRVEFGGAKEAKIVEDLSFQLWKE